MIYHDTFLLSCESVNIGDSKTKPFKIAKGSVYIMLFGMIKELIVSLVEGIPTENLSIVNCEVMSKQIPKWTNIYYQKTLKSNEKEFITYCNNVYHLHIGRIVSFTDSIILSMIGEFRNKSIVFVGLTGLDWNGLEKIYRVAEMLTGMNKDKSIVFIQGNTIDITFPEFVWLELTEECIDIREWILKTGIRNDTVKFSLKS